MICKKHGEIVKYTILPEVNFSHLKICTSAHLFSDLSVNYFLLPNQVKFCSTIFCFIFSFLIHSGFLILGTLDFGFYHFCKPPNMEKEIVYDQIALLNADQQMAVQLLLCTAVSRPREEFLLMNLYVHTHTPPLLRFYLSHSFSP